MIAYQFGVVENEDNIFENSPYNLIDKATEVEKTSKFNPRLGKNTTTTRYNHSGKYRSIVDDFKD